MSDSSTPVIELQGLEVKFGGRAILKGLSASLTGRCIGLLGPNGAGKTTLLHTLLGFHPPSAGTARIFGHDIRTADAGHPRPHGLHARDRRLHRRHDRGAVRAADGRDLGAALGARPGARPRDALLRRPGRGPLPQGGDLLAGHEAARQARPGAGARAAAHLPRRADQRPRPLGPRAHAAADPRHPRHGRGQHHPLLPPAARRRGVLRGGARPEERAGSPPTATSRRSGGPTASSWSSRCGGATTAPSPPPSRPWGARWPWAPSRR